MIADIAKVDAFEEGYNAAIDGLLQQNNPYPVGSGEHEDWNHGFMAFEQDDNDA